MAKQNPVALAGAHRAGTLRQQQLGLGTRATPQTQYLRRLRRQRQIEIIHGLGARAVFELIDQLDREYGLGEELDRLLSRFAGLDPAILAATGGDRFPAAPTRVVAGAR